MSGLFMLGTGFLVNLENAHLPDMSAEDLDCLI